MAGDESLFLASDDYVAGKEQVTVLMWSTPVQTARNRPEWVHPSAHWTEIGEMQSHYVPRAHRPKPTPWLPILLALSAVVTTVAASAVTVVAVVIVALVI